MPRSVNIYLLGSGIRGTLQITRETEQAIQACSTIFVLHDDPEVLAYCRRYCSDVRDVVDFYSTSATRPDVYSSVADAVVERADLEDTIGLLVHGHPLFLVSAAEYTIERGRNRGLRVRVLPAVSSFDTLLCELEVDYGYGLQLFDATTMLQHGWLPNPCLPLLVFQLATILTDAVISADPSPAALEPLVRRLREVYGPTHRCVMVRSAGHVLEATQKVWVTVEQLDRELTVPLWERPTLYVPSLDPS